MIYECKIHGFYKDKICPYCNKVGKFVLSDEKAEIISKTLAGILRHYPSKLNLAMDIHGWVNIYMLINTLRTIPDLKWLKKHHILAIIDTDDKHRYEVKNNKIRATYGHTVDIELDLPTDNIPDILYYPVTKEELPIILESGIMPVDRKYVHLSKSIEKAKEAGWVRTSEPVILKVNSKKIIEDGVKIMQAGRTVYITKNILPQYLEVINEDSLIENQCSE